MGDEAGNATYEVLSPLDGAPISSVEGTLPADVRWLVQGAAAAQEEWAAREPQERRRVLLDVASAIRSAEQQIAELETHNTGKHRVDTEREVRRAAECFEYYAGWVDHIMGETIPMGVSNHVYTSREPVGVVAGIVPWNMPFAFAAKKIAPALAFGNACILKPAPETPLTALLLVDLLRSAGVPDGLVHVVVGGAQLGAALVDDPGLGLVVFTGSVGTGRIVGQAAAKNLVPCVLELGGASAQVIFADADLDAASEAVVLGGFASTGQMCIAGRRILVEESIYEEFVERVAKRVEALTVGDVRTGGVSLGPQVTSAQQKLTQAAIESAIASGRAPRAQGLISVEATRSGGFYVAPTLFADVPEDSPLVREEIFGPVVSMLPFKDATHALRLVNDSDYGLVAGVWTRDIALAHTFAAGVEAGTVWINTYRVLNDKVPFGGVKNSGFGRENGSSALDTYTQVKSVWAALNIGATHGYALGN